MVIALDFAIASSASYRISRPGTGCVPCKMVVSAVAQFQRRTTGDVPPATMGSTVTVVGKMIYVIAGRLVASKQMISDVYCLDLTTCIWRKLVIEGANLPPARYFHTAAAYGQSIVIHGGMGNLEGAEAMCVLGDVVLFDTKKKTWTTCYSPELSTATDLQPRPRYAHLSVVSSTRLVILGGQDIQNDYLEDAAVYDLQQHTWTGIHPLTKQCGTYRSTAVNGEMHSAASYPTDSSSELKAAGLFECTTTTSASHASSGESLPDGGNQTRNELGRMPSHASVATVSSVSSLNRSIPSNRAIPAPKIKQEKSENDSISSSPSPTEYICLYSNFSFRDVQRELHLIGLVNDGFNIVRDQSASLVGPVLPPGLRFPSGNIIGDRMVISGTYLSNSSQSFSVWVMSMSSFIWQKIDLDALLSVGSWNKGIYCEAMESYCIFGNRDRSLLDDYNKRQINYDHLTVLNLDAFGMTNPAGMNMSPTARDLGLLAMADPVFTDMDLITQDGTVIPVLSKILISKWPGFLDIIASTLNPGRPSSVISTNSMHDSTIADRVASILSAQDQANTSMLLNYATTRPRCFYMPYPHAIVHAFVRFLYTDLLTPSLEQSVDQLCALLVFSCTLNDRGTNPHLYRLNKLCKDCLHRLLTPKNARGIYEIGILTGQTGLQIRALEVMNQSGSVTGSDLEVNGTNGKQQEQMVENEGKQSRISVRGVEVIGDGPGGDAMGGSEFSSVRQTLQAVST